MLKLINAALVIVLLLLVRKLIWCFRWLWCYYHGREVPDPIGWLPGRSGDTFNGHIQSRDNEEDPS